MTVERAFRGLPGCYRDELIGCDRSCINLREIEGRDKEKLTEEDFGKYYPLSVRNKTSRDLWACSRYSLWTRLRMNLGASGPGIRIGLGLGR